MRIAFIPARGGSKGLPGKNIKIFSGKPVIAYTIEAAQNSDCFDRIIVSTDCKKIAEIAQYFGAEIPFLRQESLATDIATTNDVIVDFIQQLNLKSLDCLCILQPTSPLRSSLNIKESFKIFQSNGQRGSCISVVKSKMSPEWIMTLKKSDELNITDCIKPTNRQERGEYYYPNGAIYWVTVKHFLTNNQLYTTPVYSYIMRAEESVDIDDSLDFKIAEFLHNNLRHEP